MCRPQISHLLAACLLVLACSSESPQHPDGSGANGSSDVQDTVEQVCYSPTMNQAIASQAMWPGYAGDVQGCTCVTGQDQDQCAPIPGGGKVALLCQDGRWRAVWDGPCFDTARNDGGAGTQSGDAARNDGGAAVDGSAAPDGRPVGTDGTHAGPETSGEMGPAPDGSQATPDHAPIDGAALYAPPPAVAAVCGRRSISKTWLAEDEARARILGRWLLCTERGLFHQPQAGIEIRSDGRWSLLAWASGGGLTILRGAEAEGTIRVFDTGQISFSSDAGGTVGPGGFFGTDPRAMRIDNIAVYLYDYVAAEEVDLGNVEPQ